MPTPADLALDFDPAQKKLTIRGLKEFPHAAYDYVDRVEILDLSGGQLTDLPADMARFKKLRIGFFSGNDFAAIPTSLAGCGSLEMVGFKSCKISYFPVGALPKTIRGIILTDNQLSELPRDIGEYKTLQKLMISGNHLQTLPRELLGCERLALLRLSMNELKEPPDWLFTLPQLAWYSDSGNPFSQSMSAGSSAIRDIAWGDITIGPKIGESAKNTVYRGRLRDGQDVALKLYGADITTDGSSEDDMLACLLAGEHPSIIGGLGRLVQAPNNQQGLVMPLVPSTFIPLGSPPDFVSLTRDVYPVGKTFPIGFIHRLMADTVEALHHLHEKGITHGDVYAHNILVDPGGQALLGDFGAASRFLPGSDPGKMRERIDVRGLGNVIDDLLPLITDADAATIDKLVALRDACCLPNTSSVPTARDVISVLSIA